MVKRFSEPWHLSFLDNPKEKPKRHGVASEQCGRKVTQPMKIEKYFDKQLKRNCYRVDITIEKTRIRQGKFASYELAHKFVVGLQASSIYQDFGLPSPLPPTTIEQFLAIAKIKSTRPLQKRVLEQFGQTVDGIKSTNHPHLGLLEFDRVGNFSTIAAKLYCLRTA